ncbi:hypothetical protein F5141DRAFT_177353 [Pisolithus sp. B1]|nr:hypothetical protein F5141DRAFT_177353 [Pisolithus sp. B1]
MSVAGGWTREKSSIHFSSLALGTAVLSRMGRVRGSPRAHKEFTDSLGNFRSLIAITTHSSLQYGNSDNKGQSCRLAITCEEDPSSSPSDPLNRKKMSAGGRVAIVHAVALDGRECIMAALWQKVTALFIIQWLAKVSATEVVHGVCYFLWNHER